MSHVKLTAVLASLTKSLARTEQLAAAAERWSSAPAPKCVPRFSRYHREVLTEIAFLRSFLAWEAFLEESFVLYLLGKTPPNGKAPKRYVYPPTRDMAQSLAAEGRDYTDWTVAGKVSERAERFFRGGKPYSPVLRSRQRRFEEMKTLRNAISHSSAYSAESFKRLVRNRLKTYPRNLTVAGFLALTVPGSSPPESFLESYLADMRFAAERIVPV